ncbi:U-box domain-containing protein 45 [Aegilops tauschii subsp. strangulata]|uniref:U-box domain-containing protein 4 n=3 Tax=Aegilops tauschii subsp. strangulata TaxID=200361 RepID=A0A453KXG7_AEGTS|nr:U-box domain-containing protein 7 [Aegilops tauschii subsp. strangulata]
MVVRCVHADAGGFRLWPVFSAATMRRKLLEVLTCGGGGGSCRGRTSFRSPQPRAQSQPRPRSDRLAELLRAEPSECGDDEGEADAAARKSAALEELKVVVAALQDGEGDVAGGVSWRVEAATVVRRKAKDDAMAREMLAMLGAIPPLVAMLDQGGGGEELLAAALYALLNMGIGNDTNKAAIVQAGAVHKMLRIAEGASGALTGALVANFLCLSALDANKPIIGASGAAPFLVRAFEAAATEQVRHDALRALLNLSIAPANAPHLLSAGLAPSLIAAIGGMSASDRALAALCNVVAACPEGRRAVSRAPDAVPVLVDVLNWSDDAGCQEKAAYVLMVLAHRSYGDRAAMAEAGATSALLELTLVGTALAQKRASRILEILRADKGKQVADASGVVATVSAPQERGGGGGRCQEEEEAEAEGEACCMSNEKRAVRQLVQQSLQSNMRRIVRRARLPQDLAPPDGLKALTSSSTSKSLPF